MKKKNYIKSIKTNLILSLKNLIIGINCFKKRIELNSGLRNPNIKPQILYSIIQCNFNLIRKNFLSKERKSFVTLNNASKLEKFYNEQIRSDYIRSIFLKKVYFIKKENKLLSIKIINNNNNSSLIGEWNNKSRGKKHFNDCKFQRYDKLIDFVNPSLYQRPDFVYSRPLSKIVSNRFSLI